MPDTLIKFKTGDLSKIDNGATDEVGINNGTVYFATDDTTKNGKIYFDSPEGDRIDMTAYAKESNYATLAGNIDGVVSVANGGTGATDAATARTNLEITPANIGAASTTDLNSLANSFNTALSSATSALGQAISQNYNTSVHTTAQTLTENQKNQVKDNLFISKNIIDGSSEKSLRQLSAYPETAGVYSLGAYAIALGSDTKASGASSIAEGWSTLASGENSHAEGSWSESTSQASHAEGYRTKASSNYAHAEGTNTLAAVGAGHAEGNNTIASGTLASHAEGSNTMASGMYAHAEGSGVFYSIRLNGDAGATTYTLTTPVEIYPWSMSSSSFGYVTANNSITKARITAITKSGNNVTSITVNETLNAGAAITNTSFIWIMPQARGAQSHTEGLATVALGSSQHVGGQYNIPDSTSLEIIGNGTSNLIRSNARTLDKDGNEVLSGKLTVGTGPTDDMDVATKQYVDNAFSVNDAMVFKGVLDSPSNIPDTHQAGWTYRIGTTGTYAGKICEVGDLLICTVNGTTASDDHWNVVQNNIDGALFKGTNTFTDGQVLIADGVTGKTKTSGFTIAKSVPSDAIFTDTVYAHPTYTAHTAAAVKVGNDTTGHVVLGSALTANDLDNIVITNPTDGQILSYNSTTSKWINITSPYLTESQVNVLIAAALAEYENGDEIGYGFADGNEVSY